MVQRSSVSFETALATFRVIDKYMVADYDSLGVSPDDFALTNQESAWVRHDLPVVMRVLNTLTFGTLEMMAMPKIVVPAEYQAAIISAFVGRGNIMAACIWLAQERQVGAGALDMSARGQTTSQLDPVFADGLFALCVALNENSIANQVRQNFAHRLGLAVEKATLEDVT